MTPLAMVVSSHPLYSLVEEIERGNLLRNSEMFSRGFGNDMKSFPERERELTLYALGAMIKSKLKAS